jgi:hypothetical protein
MNKQTIENLKNLERWVSENPRTKKERFLEFLILTLIHTVLTALFLFNVDNDEGLSYSYYFIFCLPFSALLFLYALLFNWIEKRIWKCKN